MKRSFCLIILLLIGFLPYSHAAHAQADVTAAQAMAPWMNAGAREDRYRAPVEEEFTASDLKRLSIADLTGQAIPDLDPPAKLTLLEDLYTERAGEELLQYGYAFFGAAEDFDPTHLPAGVIQDDYILSAGDKLDITVRGQISSRESIRIGTDGNLVIDNFMPVTAAGRSLGDVRDELQAQAAEMHNTKVFVSLSGVRQIGVLVAGHVEKPGRQNLTGFHSVLDALMAAGGVQKTGSLRNIKLVRGGRSTYIDLYTVMMHSGDNADMLLRDGDRILIPPIGATLAVAGKVKRPGIYEIRRREKLSLNDLLGLSGGLLTPGENRFLKRASGENGEEPTIEIHKQAAKQFGDGSLLLVQQAQRAPTRTVTLKGHTRKAGPHDFTHAGTLAKLIDSEKVFGPDIYPLIGVITRKDKDKLSKTLIEFSPKQVVRNIFDRKLEEGDEITLFSTAQIHALQDAENPLFQEASFGREQDKITDPVLAAFLEERSAFVRGAVRRPGPYPVAYGTSLDSVMAVAGGTTIEANLQNVEVTSRLAGEGHQAEGRSGVRRIKVNIHSDDITTVEIGPGDTIRVNQAFKRVEDQSVMIMGEVHHPGRYDLMAGDTVLDLIERAGGLTQQGYPDGAIFSRAAERKREESRYKAQARDLEMKLAASLQNIDKDEKPDMAQVTAVQSLVAELKHAQAVGRITVEVDPSSLKADPEQNMLLEAGDRIYIPKRPLTVRVAGEVLSPAGLQFRSGKSPNEYIREAGGTTYYADTDRAFVVFPDGSAKPLNVSMWNHSPTFVPPGSTIIVPRDPKPFDFLESAERISSVLANLAISGLYIEAIGDDD